MRDLSPIRREMVETSDGCDICGAMAHCVHEIARGAHRENALQARYAVLILCSHCHQDVHEGEKPWPVERQLAALGEARPGDMNLGKFNELRGRAENAITIIDLQPYVKEMRR